MASKFESLINKGSDLFYDFFCFTCLENDINNEAEFYCKECSKQFCGKCVELHNTLFKKHATLGKENISQWPQTNVDALEQCQQHKQEKLTKFCEDHGELICHACHVYNHKKCSHVVPIADKVGNLLQKGDFNQLSLDVAILYQHLTQKKGELEENKQSLEKSYKKNVEEINILRKQINDSFDQLERNTIKELDTLLAYMKRSIQTDIENCTKFIKSMQRVQEDWLKRKDKSEALNLIMYRKCLDQSLKTKEVLQKMTTKNERTVTFYPDKTIQQTLSLLSGLGQILSTVKQSQPAERTSQNTITRQNTPKASSLSDPGNQTTPEFMVKKSNPDSSSFRQYSPGNQTSDLTRSGLVSDPVLSSSHQLVKGYQHGAVSKTDPIIKVKRSKKYSVTITTDSIFHIDRRHDDKENCYISGICETATGELLITDSANRKVKLLDQTYKMVAHCSLPYTNTPYSMCSIDSSLVAVAVGAGRGIIFIRVANGQLIQDRKIKEFKQEWCGIAHHQGNLYITGRNALYTVNGRHESMMYEDTSDEWTVSSCAVSPDGDRIYVANIYSNQLVTLSRDGKVISKLTDPALNWRFTSVRPGIHVTDSGQVLVCGLGSNTIIQVDRDGRQRLAVVVTEKDGVKLPTSVYYSKCTGTLIVGMYSNDDIMVFQTQ